MFEKRPEIMRSATKLFAAVTGQQLIALLFGSLLKFWNDRYNIESAINSVDCCHVNAVNEEYSCNFWSAYSVKNASRGVRIVRSCHDRDQQSWCYALGFSLCRLFFSYFSVTLGFTNKNCVLFESILYQNNKYFTVYIFCSGSNT